MRIKCFDTILSTCIAPGSSKIEILEFVHVYIYHSLKEERRRDRQREKERKIETGGIEG